MLTQNNNASRPPLWVNALGFKKAFRVQGSGFRCDRNATCLGLMWFNGGKSGDGRTIERGWFEGCGGEATVD